jgi:hypothetical protein
MLKVAAPNAYRLNVVDVQTRLAALGAKYELGNALKEITADGVIVENVDTKEEKKIDADAVVLSLGYKPDQSLKAGLEEKGICTKVIGSAVVDGTIAPATRGGYEVGASLFKEAPLSFKIGDGQFKSFSKISHMRGQEGTYVAYLTQPEAIREVLPEPLEPFSIPVVTVSACHIKNPTFADNYYEAILGVYCTYKGQLGMYTISLVLGGQGAEMATQLGRDNSAIPKKLDAEFVIRRDDETGKVTVGVTRRGTQLIDLEMQLGQYNHPLMHVLYQSPAPGAETAGSGYYIHFDRLPDENGVWNFANVFLMRNVVKYKYDDWKPGFVTKFELKSSIDDPWACLPVNTIIGGAYAENNLLITALQKLEDVDAESTMKKILPAWYDRTAFMEVGRK